MHTRLAKVFLVVGIVLVFGAVAFRAAAVPKLVRYPDDVNITLHYTGTYTSYVDDVTLETLAKPVVLPFSLDRHMQVVAHTASTAVVHETLTFHRGNLPVLTQENQYVLDRYTMQLEGGSDSWAFTPSNKVDRSGSYRVQFPMGTNAGGDYPVWNNETSRTVALADPSPVHRHAEAATSVVDFSGSLDHAVTPAYASWLESNGFPTSISSDQVQAQLTARGVDIGAAFAAVGGQMTAQETKVLTDTLAKSVPLQYSFVYDGQVSIEPKTGTIMDVHSQREGVAVKPDLTGVAALRPILARFADVPAVKAVSDGLDKLAAEPPQIAGQFSFTQTPASSAEVGREAASQIRLMNLLEFRAPWAVGVIGVLVLGVDLALAFRRRHQGEPAILTVPPDLLPSPEPEREPVGAGTGRGGAS